MSKNPLDEFGRVVYARDVVPPMDDPRLAIWRGLVVAEGPARPNNSVSGCHPKSGKPYAICTAGWVRSGAWWLHCAVCHNMQEVDE